MICVYQHQINYSPSDFHPVLPFRRETAVRRLLDRHATLEKTPENESIETFLIENLHIQPSWIHEAKVGHFCYPS